MNSDFDLDLLILEILMPQEFEIIEKAIGPVIEIEEQAKVWSMPATFGEITNVLRNIWPQTTRSVGACPMRVTRKWSGSGS